MCSHLGRCNRPNVRSGGALGTGHCSQHNLTHLAGASAHHHATSQACPSMQGSHANPHAAGSWPLWGALPPQCNTTASVAMALAAVPQASAVAAPPACQQCGTSTHGISCSVANIGYVGPRHHARWAIHCGMVGLHFAMAAAWHGGILARLQTWHKRSLTHGTHKPQLWHKRSRRLGCKTGSRTLGWPWAHGKQSQPQIKLGVAGVWHKHGLCDAVAQMWYVSCNAKM